MYIKFAIERLCKELMNGRLNACSNSNNNLDDDFAIRKNIYKYSSYSKLYEMFISVTYTLTRFYLGF